MSSDMNKDPGKFIEFPPDALKIKNKKLPDVSKFGVLFSLILVVGAIICVLIAKTDVLVQVGGKLVSDQPMIVMKPLERSVIKEIKVKAGDEVKKGDVLITFDPAFNRAEVDLIKNEIKNQEALFACLQSEFRNQKYDRSNGHFSNWQQEIYLQRQEYFKQRIICFDEALKQIDAMEKSKKDILAKQKERLGKIRKMEKIYSELYEKKAGTQSSLNQVSMERVEMEIVVDQVANDLLELQHRRGTTLAEKNLFIQEWRNKISEDMVTAERNLIAARKEYNRVAQRGEYVELVAPGDAVVHEVAFFSPGSAVCETDVLITLVPRVSVKVEGE